MVPTYRDRTAAILIIGNEILTGKVVDTNSPYLLKELFQLGVTVRRVLTVPDEVDIIAAELRQLAEGHNFVLTTGGVGPTHDDVTLTAVARAFGVELVEHPELMTMLAAYFGQGLTPAARRMGFLPEGARLIRKPGIRYPQVAVKNVYIFPGVPDILRLKFDALKDEFRCAPYHLVRVYTLESEEHLAARLEETVAQYPPVDIGSYPRFDTSEYRVMLTLQSKDEMALEGARQHLLSLLDPGALVRVEQA